MTLQLRARIRCREIRETDFAGVAELLAHSFTDRAHQLRQLERLAQLKTPAGRPRFGHLLEHDGRPVGAVLTIYSSFATSLGSFTRCNLSSWHVESQYSSYGALLIAQALKYRDVTYVNVTARPSTWPIVAAQGFVRYSTGTFVAMPLFTRRRSTTTVKIISADASGHQFDGAQLSADEQLILLDHARFGCLAMVCQTASGTHPFVLAPRQLKGRIPCVQLAFCRSVDAFVQCAGNIGRALARRGIFFVTIDANQAIDGLAGRYFADKMPKFVKGQGPVRLGDLAYTNISLFCDL